MCKGKDVSDSIFLLSWGEPTRRGTGLLRRDLPPSPVIISLAIDGFYAKCSGCWAPSSNAQFPRITQSHPGRDVGCHDLHMTQVPTDLSLPGVTPQHKHEPRSHGKPGGLLNALCFLSSSQTDPHRPLCPVHQGGSRADSPLSSLLCPLHPSLLPNSVT